MAGTLVSPPPPARTISDGHPGSRGQPPGTSLFHARSLGNGPKSCRWDSNPGPRPYQGRALPAEPRQQVVCFLDVFSALTIFRPLRRVWPASRSFSPAQAPWISRERVMGIEPTQPAWKAGALPLSYTREKKEIRPIVPGRSCGPRRNLGRRSDQRIKLARRAAFSLSGQTRAGGPAAYPPA